MKDNQYMMDNYKIIGNKFKDENQLEKALHFYHKAYQCKGGDQDVELLLDMGLLYDEMGNYDAAKEMYEKVLQIDPKDARGYYSLAIAYDNEKNYIKAIKYYKKAIELDPYYDKAYFFLANAYDELGEKKKAIKFYHKVIELSPEDFGLTLT